MSDWFTNINNRTESIFTAITQHGFIQGIVDGSLDPDIFKFYIKQDTNYLSVYKKLLATLGTQCQDDNECQFFLASATGVLAVEQALHQQFAGQPHGSSELSPTCELYTSYLAKTISAQPLAVGMAAVLPCFTIYKAVGDYILAQPQVTDNRYQDWINTYGGEEFAESTANAIAITNRHAALANDEVRNSMNQAFVKASKLEWMFWDSAFKQEKWPL